MKYAKPIRLPFLKSLLVNLTISAAIVSLPSSALAWGKIGHRAAARIAEDHLSTHAKAALRLLLGPGVRLADIANWADEQREIAGTATWHYVNVPIRESRYDRRYCPGQGCVVSKIEDFRHILEDPAAGKAQKQLALRYLVHFIADLHQPLHVGDDSDKGGNLLQVRFFDEGSNLHSVWDSQIINRHTENENVWVWELTFVANPKSVAEWSKGNPEGWATESVILSKTVRRVPGSLALIKPGARIGSEYYKASLTTIQRQLAKAGIRTAWVLNQIFQ
jgi:nuclease S1